MSISRALWRGPDTFGREDFASRPKAPFSLSEPAGARYPTLKRYIHRTKCQEFQEIIFFARRV
jgi:hypothetical protein